MTYHYNNGKTESMTDRREVVFDVETKKSFAEVGSRDANHLLGVSVAVAYSYAHDDFFVFEEHQLDDLFKFFKDASRIIGFNIRDFDIPVLAPYTTDNLFTLPILDMMDDVQRSLGFRIGLDNLATNTIKASKSAHGLQALEWFKAGEIEKIKKYCRDDVRITRDLFEYGKTHGHVIARVRDNPNPVSVGVRWGDRNGDTRILLQDAFTKRRRVEIEYITKSPSDGAQFNNIRKVDIYSLGADEFEGFCHLRQGKRVFKFDRVFRATPTEETYVIVNDVQPSLL